MVNLEASWVPFVAFPLLGLVIGLVGVAGEYLAQRKGRR